MGNFDPSSVRALAFDVFGTVVDWRSSVIRQCEAVGERLGLRLDWGAFVDDWRIDGYYRGTVMVRKGELPPMTADQLHRRKLDLLIADHGIRGLDEDETQRWSEAWHRLDPWPDAVGGLARLRRRYLVSTLSNGNLRLLVDMARYAGLTWDCILSADVTGAFKPEPQCYLRGCELLGLAPAQVLMVAAHKADLRAAAACGLRTAFTPRPLESGPNVTTDLAPDPSFDLVAASFHDLAAQLDCPE